jgi:hypothetical protein
VDFEDLIYQTEVLEHWLDSLSWIHDEFGSVPFIDGLPELCTKVELEFARKNKRRKLTNRFRKITGDRRFALGRHNSGTAKYLCRFSPNLYTGAVLNLKKILNVGAKEDRSNIIIFVTIIKYFPAEQVELQEYEEIFSDEEDLKMLLNCMRGDKEAQRKLCALCKKYHMLDSLFSLVQQEQLEGMAYAGILRAYYADESEKDEVLKIDETI